MTPWAAKWAACCDEPHWRSTEVAGTVSGKPAARTALRPMLRPWLPTCMTQPMITSSMSAGSRLLRSARALSTSPARSAACQPDSFPLRLPPAVRPASTMTAVGWFVLLRTTRPSLLTGRSSLPGVACDPQPGGGAMDERVDNLAGVVAAVTEAAATSLDPVSILRRTRAALEPMVAVAAMSLWRSTRGTTALVAADADADVGSPDAVDFAVEEARPG